MGTQNGNYRRSILEMVLVTGIFAVISVFILRLYLAADRLQGQAVTVSTATVRSESILEYAAARGTQAAAAHFGMQEKDGYYVLYFDKNWEQNSQEKQKYAILLTEYEEPAGLRIAQVSAGLQKQEENLRGSKEDSFEGLCRISTWIRQR